MHIFTFPYIEYYMYYRIKNLATSTKFSLTSTPSYGSKECWCCKILELDSAIFVIHHSKFIQRCFFVYFQISFRNVLHGRTLVRRSWSNTTRLVNFADVGRINRWCLPDRELFQLAILLTLAESKPTRYDPIEIPI